MPERTPHDFTCPACGAAVRVDRLGTPTRCSACRERLRPTAQLGQLLARWWEPRRWRADLVQPSVPYLIERLWTANDQGVRLYEGIAPAHANYDVFRSLVTRAIMKGVDEGWAELRFPEDPLLEDPQYELRIADSEKFATAVEALFPEVNWEETVEAPPLPDRQPPPASDGGARPKR